jgi:gamma-glutamylcyclotransferase (GGCT)/AIG2-like uncharacterized protein YtfP
VVAVPNSRSNDLKNGLKVAVYGTLMKGFGGQELAGIAGHLKLLGSCTLPGLLYDLGKFPALVPGRGTAAGKLYEAEDPTVLAKLDQYEEFDEGHLDQSLFVRRYVRLTQPPVGCWVYFYNRDVTGKPRIADGNWAKHTGRCKPARVL